MVIRNWRSCVPWMEPKIHGAGIDWRLFSQRDAGTWVTTATGEREYHTDDDKLTDEGKCLKKIKFFSFAMLQPGKSYMPHDHSHEEVYYIIKGKGHIKGIKDTGTEDFPVRSGDVVITPVGEKHQIINDGCEMIEFIAWACDERY